MIAREAAAAFDRTRPRGILAVSVFFLLAAIVSGATALALALPGGPLEWIWRLKPSARSEMAGLGALAVPLMVGVSVACLLSASGLLARKAWGAKLGVIVLGVNLTGDLLAAVLRHDPRTLIGLPIAGAMIAYLARALRRHDPTPASRRNEGDPPLTPRA